MTPARGRIRLPDVNAKRMRLLTKSLGVSARLLEAIHGHVLALQDDKIDDARRRALRELAREHRLIAMLIEEACE